MTVPGFLLSLLTCPGVIVHEIAHLLCCRLLRVHVLKVCYFRLGNPAGYVLHEAPSAAWQALLIGLGPFFVNTLLGALTAYPAVVQGNLASHWSGKRLLLLWLGVAIAMHARPSTGDAKAMWRAVWSRGTSIWTKLLATPLVALVFLIALWSIVWLDLAYGAAVVLALPWLLNHLQW